MPRWTKRPSDPVLADLYLLADKTAVLPSTISRCPALLDLLSTARQSGPDIRPEDKPLVLQRVIYEILDEAYESWQDSGGNAFVGMVLAAGAIMGLVTEGPKERVKRKPSKMERIASTGSKEVRQGIAGSWLNPPVSWETFRKRQEGQPTKEHQSLESFRKALLDKLGFPEGISGKPTSASLGGDEAAEVSSPNETSPAKPLANTESNNQGIEPSLEKMPEGGPPTVPRTFGKKPIITGVSLAVAVLAAAITSWKILDEPSGRTVVVYNKVTNGAAQMREDTDHPAYLSTKPQNYCKDRACAVPNTDMVSGARLTAICRAEGEESTNGDGTSELDDQNPELATSKTWYGVRLDDGRFGYISEVWLEPDNRGGLGLPICGPR